MFEALSTTVQLAIFGPTPQTPQTQNELVHPVYAAAEVMLPAKTEVVVADFMPDTVRISCPPEHIACFNRIAKALAAVEQEHHNFDGFLLATPQEALVLFHRDLPFSSKSYLFGLICPPSTTRISNNN